jgi:selenocysteine-specific elongation factor
VLAEAVHRHGPIDLVELASRVDMTPTDVEPELTGMERDQDVTVVGAGPGKHYLSAAGWRELAGEAQRSVTEYHGRFPARRGEPKEELRSHLGLTGAVFGPVLARLSEAGVLVEAGASVRTPDHAPSLSVAQEKTAAAFVASLDAGDPYSPPTDNLPEEDVLELLEDRGLVVRASDAVVFSASNFDSMVKQIKDFVGEHGQVTVGDVRDLFATSRKYALALLEHLDKTRVTRRVDDARVLR